MSLFQKIHEMFRCCLHCGSFQVCRSLFCQNCEAHLWERHQNVRDFQIFDSEVCGLALFDWYPDSDRKVSKLMVTLKGGRLEEALRFYAEIFVSHLPELPLPVNSVLVPCPNKPDRKHALNWARELSNILQVPIVEALTKPEVSSSQKSKRLRERVDLNLTCQVDLRSNYVIFIDDIVTTGATALSAHRAIGSPENFEVWCLAHRRQLAAIPTL